MPSGSNSVCPKTKRPKRPKKPLPTHNQPTWLISAFKGSSKSGGAGMHWGKLSKGKGLKWYSIQEAEYLANLYH